MAGNGADNDDDNDDDDKESNGMALWQFLLFLFICLSNSEYRFVEYVHKNRGPFIVKKAYIRGVYSHAADWAPCGH